MSTPVSDNLSNGFLENIVQPRIEIGLFHHHEHMSKIWKQYTNPMSVNYSIMFMPGHHHKPYKILKMKLMKQSIVLTKCWPWKSPQERIRRGDIACHNVFVTKSNCWCHSIPHGFIKWLHCEHCIMLCKLGNVFHIKSGHVEEHCC